MPLTLGPSNIPWTTYTPALTAATSNPTLGTASVATGRYNRDGRTITGWAYIAFGTAGTAAGTGEYRISLPVPARVEANNVIIGSGYLYDASANVLEQIVFTTPATLSAFGIMFKNGTFQINPTTPWAWTISDTLTVNFTYEAAS